MSAALVGPINWGIAVFLLGFIVGIIFAAWRQTVIERDEDD